MLADYARFEETNTSLSNVWRLGWAALDEVGQRRTLRRRRCCHHLGAACSRLVGRVGLMSFGTEAALLLALLGVGVGAFGTLVGAGGGFILTPVLLLIYPHDSARTLTAISLAVVFFNALSGSIAYGRQRRIDYRSGLVFGAATLPARSVVRSWLATRPGGFSIC